jgi:archaellum component FlaC
MDASQMVTEFTDQLKEQKATIVELEKQLSTRKEQVLRLEGAIEALNMTLKKPEEDATQEVK